MNRIPQTFDEALAQAGEDFEERDADHGEGHRQRDVFEAFRDGKHVVLHAPTGWGKTFAVLAALRQGHTIYSLPMRSLVDSIAEEADELGLRRCAAQHGERREHRLLDRGDDPGRPVECVFTTLDQTLSAYLGIPVGVSFRQGNLLTAVADASHLVFDEFHLFEAERSWATALFALQLTSQNGIVLTATLSGVMVEFLLDHLGSSKAGDVELVRGKRPFVNEKTAVRGDGFDSVSDLDLGSRTLIIRNQVEWAQHTAEKLRGIVDRPVYLLHSELLSKDRSKWEAEVRQVFSEDSNQEAILVATQVVEAGLDVTCDVMHTDLCPPSSFIQRIGRCARYRGETGRIVWHPVEKVSPYQNRESQMEELATFLGEKKTISPEVERGIVNLQEEQDRQAIDDFRKKNAEREVAQVRASADYSNYREHIRSIDSVNVAIGRDVSRTYNFLNVSDSKFRGDGKYASERLPMTFGYYDADRGVYDTVENRHQADFVLLSPEHAAYDPEYGIRLQEEGGAEHFIDETGRTRTEHSYDSEKPEPYWLHLQRLKYKQPASQWIASRPYVPSDLVDFVIWAHDLGKLNYQWQSSFGVPEDGMPIAHSGGEFTSDKGGRRPPHGWVSAWAVKDYLWNRLPEHDGSLKMARAAFWAIADHHGYSHDMERNRLEPYNLGYLEHLDSLPHFLPWVRGEWTSHVVTTSVAESEIEGIHNTMQQIRRKRSDDHQLYFALCYVLRRSDQLATALVSEKKEVSTEQEGNPRSI
jgi:CRISPR-associated endonuclease/helicase Cas3